MTIFDEQKRVLLCHRCDYDLWNLPGGRVESRETPWDAAKREVKEETGLEVSIERLSGVYSKPEEDDVVFNFVSRIIGGKITLSDEADEIKYFDINNLPKNTVPKQVERIRDALDCKSEVRLKTQTGLGAIELVKQGKL